MKNAVIIIPTRLAAKRFPRKSLANIKGMPMIIRVLESAAKSGVGEVYVTSPDKEILEVVNNHGGNGIITGQIFVKIQLRNIKYVKVLLINHIFHNS